MSISDEFRAVIIDSIPKLLPLLTDSDEWACRAGANTLANLSEQGKPK
jgi:UDP-N-acetylglucosamine:LPS N-acetylglucosamine transferase